MDPILEIHEDVGHRRVPAPVYEVGEQDPDVLQAIAQAGVSL